mmetsp:Transcript_42121/g.101277  ORF Transcript_42121/g.101277 Transcript_42121/m.101277 type:complete len:216 (-) Transcript_42121:16-663(-)
MFFWASSMPACASMILFFSLASLVPSRLKSATTTFSVIVFFSFNSLHWTTVMSSWVTCPSIIPLMTPRAWFSSSSVRLSGPLPLCLRNAVRTRVGIWSPTCLSIVSRGTRSIAFSKAWGCCHPQPSSASCTAVTAAAVCDHVADLLTVIASFCWSWSSTLPAVDDNDTVGRLARAAVANRYVKCMLRCCFEGADWVVKRPEVASRSVRGIKSTAG